MDARGQIYFDDEDNIPQEDIDRLREARAQHVAAVNKSLQDFEHQMFMRERQRDAEGR